MSVFQLLLAVTIFATTPPAQAQQRIIDYDSWQLVCPVLEHEYRALMYPQPVPEELLSRLRLANILLAPNFFS